MKAVEAGEGGLTHALAAAEEFNHEVPHHRHGCRHTAHDLHGPIAHLVPGKGVAGDAEAHGDHGHGHASHPGELPGALEAAGEVHAKHVKNQHQNHHRGAPAVHGADQPAEADVGHEVLHRGVGLGHSGLVIKRHREARRELDQEAHQGDAAQAVKDVDMRRHVFGRDVVRDRLDLKALLKPVEDGVGGAPGVSSRSVRHAAGWIGCESLRTTSKLP